MADLFLLSEAQMRRIECYFPLSHGIARGGRSPDRQRHRVRDQGTHFAGATRPGNMVRTRRSTTGLSAGAAWACSTRSSPSWRARAASRDGS